MPKKYFPCWVCKGKGGETEVVTDDGRGPYYPCNYCEDKGMIEINGKRHMEIKRENIAIEAVTKFGTRDEGYSVEELQEIGMKIQNLIQS